MEPGLNSASKQSYSIDIAKISELKGSYISLACASSELTE